MFCEKCGSQLGEGAAFCASCGAKVSNVSQPQQDTQSYQNQQMEQQVAQSYQNQPVDQQYVQGYQNQQMEPQYMQGYQNPQMYSQYDQGIQQQYGMPNDVQVVPAKVQKPKKDRKKINLSKKSKIIIGVAAVAVIAVVVVVLMLPGNLLSPQRRIIDEYFDAINDKDIDAIDKITYTDEVLDTVGGTNSVGELYFFTTNRGYMGFSRGLYEVDWLKMDGVVEDSYPSVIDGLSDKQVTNKTLNMLEVSYEILDIQPLEDVDVYWSTVRNPEMEKIDVEFVEDRAAPAIFKNGDKIQAEIDIDEVYVAQVDVEWKYNDMLYGIDKNWWNDDVFKERVKGSSVSTYDEAIDAMTKLNADADKYVHILILYKVDGDWNILYGNRLSTLKSIKDDGKIIILPDV